MTRLDIAAANWGCEGGRAPDPAGAEQAVGGSLYTFDCRRADGSPICLEAHELGSDERALALARKLLTEHLTCSSIEVFEAERLVGAVAREPNPRETLRATRE